MRLRRSHLAPDLAAQAKGAGRNQRNADHIAKHCAILMPADGSARRVFSDQNLLKRLRLNFRKARLPVHGC